MAKFVGSELSAPRSTALESWDRTLEDLLIRSLLLQPHSYSASLAGPVRGAAPYNVKRADAFMQAHASDALTVERIAEASGCGIRALQSAFRAFTGWSPMERLRIIRLEEAHLDLMGRMAVSTVRALAAKYRFSNSGRFTDQYRKMFGHPPRVR